MPCHAGPALIPVDFVSLPEPVAYVYIYVCALLLEPSVTAYEMQRFV